MKKKLLTIALLNLVFLLHAQKSIDVTYIANCGFQISSDTSKLLIDGIFNEGYGSYYTPDAQTLTKERNATNPFNDINAVLITHAHDDHINPSYLTEHMVNDNNAILLAPYLAVNRLKPVTGYDAIKSRIREITQTNQSKLDTTINGISIKSMAIRHIDSTFLPTLNLGYIFEINGIKVFDPGDADTANLSIYQNLALADDSIDIALIPYWFFLTNTGINIVNYLNPKAIIITHVMLPQQTYNYTYVRNRIKSITGLPPIYFMEEPMDKLNFIKDADSVFTFSESDSAYLGQTPPGSIPVLFAPEIINSSTYKAYIITFSSNGTEVFLDKSSWPNHVIKHMEFKNGKLTGPDTASFSIDQYPGEPSFSPDGNRIYYYAFPDLSNRNNTDIYYSEKQDSVWGDPISLGGPMISNVWEFHPCVINDNSIYFTNDIGEICKSQYINGTYQNPVKLTYPINFANISQVYADAYIAPDESYMIFRSNRTGGFGGFDLYIAYKNEDGSWTNPKNLGNKINTAADEGEGDITPDGKYMTFDRSSDLYWVSAGFIDSLKHTNFIPWLKNAINDTTVTIGVPFAFSLSDNVFIDDDGNNALTYQAKLIDGSPLPDWIRFDSISRTFSGALYLIEKSVPSKLSVVDFIDIRVTATDAASASVYDDFKLTIITDPLEMKTIERAEGIIVFPNPSNGLFTISFGTSPAHEALIEITNLQGNLVFSGTFNNEVAATIDLTSFPKGIYLVNVLADGKIFNEKVCLE